MQRKRTRGYYSDTVELGTHILPVARMRKLTMSNVVKYAVFLVIAYIIYSVYQKASTSNVESDYWADELKQRNKQTGSNPNEHNKNDAIDEAEQRDEINKRVKQEINKVFEEFKKQQDEKMNKVKKENVDVFRDYKVGLNKVEQDEENINTNDKQQLFPDDNGEVFRDFDMDEKIRNDDLVSQNEVNAAADDADEKIDYGMFEEEEDMEKEREELEVEKEIEERLAEAFKEAIHEAAEEVEKKKVEEDNKMMNIQQNHQPNIAGGDTINAGNIKVPEVQPVFQKKEEFKFAVNNVGKRLNPMQVRQMNENARRDALRHDDDHEFPPFVTAVRETTVKQVTQLVASVQEFFPGRKIYIYDLDLNKDTKRQLMAYCGVKMRLFMKQIFPSYVRDLDSLHWKPLVMQTALSEFGHMIWVNPKFRITSNEIAPLIHESHDQGVLAIGQSAAYSTYAATHPDMFKFIQTDVEKLSREPHFEIRAILIHNTPEVHQNIMKVFSACAMEDSCLAPEGAKWACRFDFTGRKPAGCHRYDESALNILLKNWFDFDMSRYARRNSYFKPYDSSYRPKLKTCRDPTDIKDKEL
ncbi:uncharacterized protein LOC123554262 [Mercenaria mercenaria]|uniref:uncharacterized protein LOC123554262 n=1 Tax=Mercenaria mercenaria TaxID=6596 RepID=UPI00234FB05B|nr:uncharacterized protein LOC123554262 [Mercenaria mercenaria]